MKYPSWQELTRGIRRDFFKHVPGFDNDRAMRLINREDFPAVFQMCKDLDPAGYHRFVADSFAPREQSGVYRTFVELLQKITPLFILTTNVDEILEKSLPQADTVQRSDLDRCIDLLNRRRSFVAKLHGSVSAIQSTIFTTSDYELLVANRSYISLLKCIFTMCTVVFLGYGVRDQYVIKLLRENMDEMELFGPGPHFAVTNDSISVSCLQRIGYSLKIRPDHSAALSALYFVIPSLQPSEPGSVADDKRNTGAASTSEPSEPSAQEGADVIPKGKTAYFISDLMPPGTWQTSQEITARGAGGEIEGSFGLGFTNDEVPVPFSTAMHDVIVGLICFDYVYLPFGVLGSAHNLVGSELFWELVQQDVLHFIHCDAKPGILFQKGAPIGSIGDVTGGTTQGPEPAPLSLLIRNALSPARGKEKLAESLFDELERKTVIYRRYKEANVPSLVRGALLMPSVSRLLGIGDTILPTQVPRWLRYPYLRLAHLVQTGVLCTEYGIQAAKVPFGGVQLTAAAFGVQPRDMQADHVASYVATGAYNSDLGALVSRDMSVMRKIVRFRESPEGEAFRREVAQVIANEAGRVFDASVNAGLSRAVPVAILQSAQDRLLRLMTESARITRVPAVWGSTAMSDASTRHWRAKSQRQLLEMCRAVGIGRNDPCICGSDEKLRLCCLAPLL
ncbi:MAG: SIR2 family protein [Candidatus Sulfotelmatobacter sp.]